MQGRIHLFAGLARGAARPETDTNAIHYRQLIVTGTTGSSTLQFRRTAQLVVRRRLDLTPLISREIDLDGVVGVLREARRLDELKTVVSLEDGSL
ncbi:MAG: hypothetical protein GX496_07650 [Firmicutes bacterium]|nr:hypothetical protein [Bacillota bacterium]